MEEDLNFRENNKGKWLSKQLIVALIWVIFSAGVGILFQSYEAKKLVFVDFFISNFHLWFESFGGFFNPTFYDGPAVLFASILNSWYYFFYLGGLISLVWAIIAVIFHLIFRPRNSDKKEKESQTRPVALLAKPTDEEIKKAAHNVRISNLLVQGAKALKEKDFEGAEKVYHSIEQEYNFGLDQTKELHKKILAFYQEIIKNRNS